ncbi:hypothetical protein [Reichenbachiella versicolor]|uniref:hypothetical protein n=1 Tax=Reichenbachiella versicolor TaxID=1821036 RepID=UPI0013A5AC25|nr:hypothetical protein [Reichenbachiella versicolor]
MKRYFKLLLKLSLSLYLLIGIQHQIQSQSLKHYRSLDEALLEPETVEWLELNSESMINFPDELFTFPNLKYLDLSNTRIEKISRQYFGS